MFTFEREQGRKYMLNLNLNVQIINDFLCKTGEQWRVIQNQSRNLNQQLVLHLVVNVEMFYLKKILRPNQSHLGNYVTILHNFQKL